MPYAMEGAGLKEETRGLGSAVLLGQAHPTLGQ